MKREDLVNILSFELAGSASQREMFYRRKQYDPDEWDEIHQFFLRHAIAPLFADGISCLPKECANLINVWKNEAYNNVFRYYHSSKTQEEILAAYKTNTIPVVVLKGTSAAQYYPKPQLRTVGDIDLLVKSEDYERAIQCLLAIGCIETTGQAELERGRHRSFQYGQGYQTVLIELHRYFSFNVDAEFGGVLDKLLFSSFPDTGNVFPADENGLVLLSHIRQHLECGIGFRQIIDWMMFVRKHLHNEQWFASFQKKAQVTGLEKLAAVVTKMCQKYLGLECDNITWCQSADDEICEQLMQYVFDCGNFGRSREFLFSGGASRIPSVKHPIQFLKHLQTHGEKNWSLLRKHSWLKPFAWIYQSFRYLNLVFQNQADIKKLRAIYDEGHQRNEMFALLGIK